MAKRNQHFSKQEEFKNPSGEHGYVKVEYDPSKKEITCTIKRRVPCCIPPEKIDSALDELVKTGIEGVTLELTPEEVEGIFNRDKK